MRKAIAPGIETVFKQHAAHAQQRTYSIHAVFSRVRQIKLRQRKAFLAA